MILITGGSYQGKLDFAKSRFGVSEGDIFICDAESSALDLSARCVAYIDRYALNRVRAGKEPVEAFREDCDAWRDSIIITTDISGGIVPMDATQRAWREACGRMNNYLAARADEVWRLFCGIPQRLK